MISRSWKEYCSEQVEAVARGINLVYLRKSVLVLLRNANVRIEDASGSKMIRHVKQGGKL